MPISLTDKIRSINRMNKTDNKESESEQTLIDVIATEQVWEESKEKLKEESRSGVIEDAEDKKNEHTPITLELLYSEIQALNQTIEKQVDEIKKINKHINATQKMLKKGVK